MEARALEECLSQHPKLHKVPLEIRWQAIKLEPSQRIDPKEIVRASHIHTDHGSASKVRSVLNSIYGNKNEGLFPLGKVMRFIPNLADPTFVRTPTVVANVIKCVSKQKVFLDSVTAIVTYNVDTVDYIPQHMTLSLREACMKILRPDKAEHVSLFVSIDTSFRGEITFLVKKEIVHQARAVVNTLPVIMDAKYGHQALEWFPAGSENMLNQFKWDPITRTVKSLEEDNQLTHAGKMWEHDDEAEIPDEISTSYNMLEVSLDAFPVVFADEVPSHKQYNDDRESVVTFGPVYGNAEATSDSSHGETSESDAMSVVTTEGESPDSSISRNRRTNRKTPPTPTLEPVALPTTPLGTNRNTPAPTNPPIQDIQEHATMVSIPNSSLTSEPTISEEAITEFLRRNPALFTRLFNAATSPIPARAPDSPEPLENRFNTADVTPDKTKYPSAPTREGGEEE